MTDKEFKNSNHTCIGFTIHSRGKYIEPKYGPDVVLCCRNEYIILEHESQPNRKTILGDILKAAHFLQGRREGNLVIVITPKGTSSFKSYPKHVLPYFKWLQGKSNLKNVYFVSVENYNKNDAPIKLFSKEFLKVSTSLNDL